MTHILFKLQGNIPGYINIVGMYLNYYYGRISDEYNDMRVELTKMGAIIIPEEVAKGFVFADIYLDYVSVRTNSHIMDEIPQLAESSETDEEKVRYTLLENDKLEIVDQDTIMEISTFTAKGQSYEASSGNHDDLVMNLVMFGYFVSTQYFQDMTDINIKEMMFKRKMQEIENDLPGFGYIDDGLDDILKAEDEDSPWAIEYEATTHF